MRMPYGRALVVGAPLVLAGLGCKAGCDEASLQGVAKAFAAGSLEQRQAGIEALTEACPTLPSALRWSLLADFTEMPDDERLAVQMDRGGDMMWTDLLVRTCPGALEAVEHHQAPDDERAMRELCELDRYGLLASDEPFAQRDLGQFMLYEWLISQRVDRALARAVVRPLLVVEASPADRQALCLRGELPCDEVVEAWGLRPPRSNTDLRVEGAPGLEISGSAISDDDAVVVPLVAGRPSPDAFTDHVSPVLRRRLETHPEAGHGTVAPGQLPNGRLVVAADHATPVATLVDVAFTASRAGFARIDLVAYGEHGLVGLPVSLPYAWFPQLEGVKFERALDLVFVVHGDAVEARLPGASPERFVARASCEPPPAGCHDHEAIAAYVTRVKDLFPHETVATFRIEGDVSLQALVSLMDVVRGGERCRLAGAVEGEAIPDGCLFWQAVVDLEPPVAQTGDLGSRGGAEGG